MPLSDESSELARVVEAFGEFYAAGGGPRMAGRLLGWLMVCDPPGQSTVELARALSVAKSSISTSGRMLVQAGFVERYRRPGSREVFYRISPGAWEQSIERTGDEIARWRALAERGLRVVEGSARERLEDMREFFAFFEERWPALLEQWKEEHP